jgi:hypothetical protein
MNTEELERDLDKIYPAFSAAMKEAWPMRTYNEAQQIDLRLFFRWVNGVHLKGGE